MLPKNKLRDRRLERLFIFPEDDHPYESKCVSQPAGANQMPFKGAALTVLIISSLVPSITKRYDLGDAFRQEQPSAIQDK